jgi:hypothetical protein
MAVIRAMEGGMLLRDKNAVIYRAGGSIGGAVARAFANEGARVYPSMTFSNPSTTRRRRSF